jgi:superfamily II DNA or RNA helicase
VIPGQLHDLFRPGVRTRGEEYFNQRRVRIVTATTRLLEARVTGGERYLVRLEAGRGFITLSCTCPYAIDNGICKHQWATIREAERKGRLQLLLASAGPRPSFSTGAEFRTDLSTQPATTPRRPEWRHQLEGIRRQLQFSEVHAESATAWPDNRRLVYIVDVPASANTTGLVIELASEKQEPDGSWEAPTHFRFGAQVWLAAPDPADRQIAQMLLGAPSNEQWPTFTDRSTRTNGFVLGAAAFDTTLRLMCETGRCRARMVAGEWPLEPVRWDDGPPWQLHLRIDRPDGTSGGYELSGILMRGQDEMTLSEPLMLHQSGILLARGEFARFEHSGAFPFVPLLRETSSLRLTAKELPDFLGTLYGLPRLPPIESTSESAVTVVDGHPVPCLSIAGKAGLTGGRDGSWLRLSFRYGRVRVDGALLTATVFDPESLTVYRRDRAAEAAAEALLMELGAKKEWDYTKRQHGLAFTRSKLLPAVVELVRVGWQVDTDGAAYRAPTGTHAEVRSAHGINWFELDARVRFGDEEVELPALLDALGKGETTITLSDGSVGLLPTEWLARLRPIVATGAGDGDVTRFARSQVGLLDALLETIPDVSVDDTFETARAELHGFERVTPRDPPPTFHGTLREYQREGLGWFHFLRRFRLGGCLADDMGLGKTVQVLALLEELRMEGAGPSIVVVPRSLVFNWKREAERFAPRLRVADYTGPGRADVNPNASDLIITTYGTLRRDALALASVEFEYAILDEAQAIKNPKTASSKAARLIKARHRLALSGTPIENRLEELWSLFEFLNPGMLGPASTFGAMAQLMTSGPDETDGRELLAKAMRPVILRRTKDQVAPELPPRVEQTLEVELEPAQRRFYDALLARYRRSVLERVDRVGIQRARMHVLEALLRLRQAACHPVLADASRTELPSAKLDALMPALAEVVDEGHKAVVFSQFTSFLSLVRKRLDEAGLRYEYLDGQTRDREARVDHFQSDASIPLFLVSLKAGGHGLNLTAADYVYLLDPWWNPAVEAQAIDRTHRIGQTRRVIATRLVARATIEEKILALQASKRALADAILAADNGVLAKIGREELEALLAG